MAKKGWTAFLAHGCSTELLEPPPTGGSIGHISPPYCGGAESVIGIGGDVAPPRIVFAAGLRANEYRRPAFAKPSMGSIFVR